MCSTQYWTIVVAVFAMVTFSGASTTVWTSVDWMNAFLSLTLCTNIICTGMFCHGNFVPRFLTPLQV
jgi:hypothetical protein